MNKYLVFSAESTVKVSEKLTCKSAIYSVYARDLNHAEQLLQEKGIDTSDLEIELDRENVRDQLGREVESKVYEG